MANYDTPYKPKPDTGNLRAQGAKRFATSPDYWGDIRVNLKDMTNISIEDGCHVIKISGWKRVDKQGKTYLSLAVKRALPKEEGGTVRQEDQRQDFPDMDVPF